MSTNSVPCAANDYRAASGLPRRPVALADQVPDGAHPRGPGLFEVVRGSGERMITNVRRIAGAERAPGSRLVLAATILLGLLAAGLFVVTLNAQYKYIFAAKGQQIPSVIEAASLDLGMAIFTLLALGLAMAGQAARIERALIVACALGSAAQNYAAADVSLAALRGRVRGAVAVPGARGRPGRGGDAPSRPRATPSGPCGPRWAAPWP